MVNIQSFMEAIYIIDKNTLYGIRFYYMRICNETLRFQADAEVTIAEKNKENLVHLEVYRVRSFRLLFIMIICYILVYAYFLIISICICMCEM